MSNLHFGERRYWQDFAKYFPLLLFGFALLLRVVLVFRLETYSSPYHLSEHVQIANHILNGKGYSFNWYGLGDAGEGSFMPPPYVAIVLVAKVLFPATPWLVIQIFQALLSAWVAMATYFIGKEIFSELTGMIASFLVAVYPPFLGYVLDIQTVVWETFWVVLSVLA